MVLKKVHAAIFNLPFLCRLKMVIIRKIKETKVPKIPTNNLIRPEINIIYEWNEPVDDQDNFYLFDFLKKQFNGQIQVH